MDFNKSLPNQIRTLPVAPILNSGPRVSSIFNGWGDGHTDGFNGEISATLSVLELSLTDNYLPSGFTGGVMHMVSILVIDHESWQHVNTGNHVEH